MCLLEVPFVFSDPTYLLAPSFFLSSSLVTDEVSIKCGFSEDSEISSDVTQSVSRNAYSFPPIITFLILSERIRMPAQSDQQQLSNHTCTQKI